MFIEQQIMYVRPMATLSRVQKTQSASPFEKCLYLKIGRVAHVHFVANSCFFTKWQHQLEMTIWSSEALDLILEALCMFMVFAMSCILGKCVRCACLLSGNTMYDQKSQCNVYVHHTLEYRKLRVPQLLREASI